MAIGVTTIRILDAGARGRSTPSICVVVGIFELKRKRGRKLHVGLDLVSGEIVCSGLTADDGDDPTALPDLLDQPDGSVQTLIVDSAYDGAAIRKLVATRLGEIVEVIFPPHKMVVQSQ